MTRWPTNAEVEEVLDELLAIPPKEFVAARNAAAKQLQADGDREAAGEIKALPRPSLSLWSLNRLAHEQADLIETFLDAAGKLRKAHESGGDIRAATPPEREAEARVVAAAAKLAGTQGSATETVMRGLRATVGAAAADQETAADPPSRPADPGAGGALPRPASRLAPASSPPGQRRRRRRKRPRVAISRRSVARCETSSRTHGPRRRKPGMPHATRPTPPPLRSASGSAHRSSPRRHSSEVTRRTSTCRSLQARLKDL